MKHILFTALFICVCLILTSCISVIPHETETQTLTDGDGKDTLTDESGAAMTTSGTNDNNEPDIYNGSYFDTVTRYAYNTLDADGRGLYGKLLQAALKMKASVTAGDDKDAALYVYNCLYYDSPELFYLPEEVRYKDGVIYFKYIFWPDEALEIQNALEKAYNEFHSKNIIDGMDDYEKLLAVYEYLIRKTDYARDVYEFYKIGLRTNSVKRSMCAVGPLTDGKAICTGYARATQYLAIRLGIQAMLVTGHANNGNHAFTLVKLYDEYYFVDTTWGDPSGADPDSVSHTYFCITTKEITRTHEFDCPIPVPECTANDYNYYVREGLFVTDGDISGVFSSAAELFAAGGSEYTVKYENDNLGLRAYEVINATDFKLSDAYKSALFAYPVIRDVKYYAVWTARFNLLTIKFR